MATSARDFEHRDVHARDNTEGLHETVRESTLKVDRKKNALPHQGVEPASAARQTQCSTDQAMCPPPNPEKHLSQNMCYPAGRIEDALQWKCSRKRSIVG